MRKNEEEQGRRVLLYGKAVLLGALCAFLIGVTFLLLAALGVSEGWIQPGLRYQLTVVACVLGSFGGNILACRLCGVRGVIVGAAVGAVLFLMTMTAGVVLYDSVSFENGGLGLLCGGLCGGAAAGILSGGGKHLKRKTRSKSRRGR